MSGALKILCVLIMGMTLCAVMGQAESVSNRLSEHHDPFSIQKALYEAGFYQAAIDGIIGSKTRAAIRAFQKANGLKVDGIVGPETWHELQSFSDHHAELEPEHVPQVTDPDRLPLELTKEHDRELTEYELKQKLVA